RLRGTPLPSDEIQAIERRLEGTRSTRWRRVQALVTLAAMYGTANRPDEGRRVIAALRASGDVGLSAPELDRVDGELILAMDPGAVDAAERSYRTAIQDARAREERSFELRAATSLARLWRRDGRHDEARKILEPL